MRKLVSSLVLVLLVLGNVHAQQLEVVAGATIHRDLPSSAGRYGQNQAQPNATTAICPGDTLGYTLSKASALRVLNVNGATSASAIAQYYDAPQAMSISSVRLFAYKLSAAGGNTANLIVEIYNARPDSLPMGAPLRITTVTVDTNFHGGSLAGLEKTATFPVPLHVNGPYVVCVRNNSGNPVGVVINDYTSLDGKNEWLAHAQIGGTWRHGYQVNVAGTQFNCDALIDPVVSYSLNANFDTQPGCIANPGMATFTNTSSAILRHRMYNSAAMRQLGRSGATWNFGDGTGNVRQVTEFDTTHYYSTAGSYTVQLRDTIFGWTSICTTDTAIVLGQAPVAQFSQVLSNLTAVFTNLSSNAATSWAWDFGDGQTSTAQHPIHLYATGGSYTVCLTTSSACGSDVTCETLTVACPAPATAFSSSMSNLSVSFADQTTGGANTWFWTFGDGNTSLQQNPTHTYAAAGNYLVCLKTTNACGLDSAWYWLNIVCPRPVADFASVSNGLSVDFTDLSSGIVTGHVWDFGDGINSSLQNPTHAYAAAGTYQVCLLTSNDCGSESTCKTVQVTTVGNAPSQNGVSVSLSPNPATHSVKITATLPAEDDLHVQVLNVFGQELKSMDLGIARHAELLLQVDDLAPGSYFVRVHSANSVITRQLTIVR
ncbi:MAG TPA: PKD domain-containing protein [Bacteroidia bacterium]|nr:PKD domain-containing protein [Bacteroidia bacterium]